MQRFKKNLINVSFGVIFLQCILAGCTHAQRTINLSTDANVVEQLERQKKEKFNRNQVCIERLKDWEKIIVIGFFRNDYGCHFDGAFVNYYYYETSDSNLSKTALAAMGWKKADQTDRERLALNWVEKGLLAYFTVLYTKDKSLTDKEFLPPQAVSAKNGEIIVTLWTSVMRRKKEFQRHEFRFAENGHLLEKLIWKTEEK